jgi:nicotinic acid phosphoribosyltransferase
LVGYVLNDFGFRGVSSVQSAKHGGSAHLINFDGSDTVVASKLIRELYNTDTIFGKSIPTEHSIMTLKGEEGEGVNEKSFNIIPNRFSCLCLIVITYSEHVVLGW